METNARSTFKILFYLKKNAPKKNGLLPIMCRITVNGKPSAFSTQLDVSASAWDLRYGRLQGKSKQAQEINTQLDKLRQRIEIYHRELRDNGSLITADKLKKMVQGNDHGQLTFLVFFKQFNLDFERKVKSGLRTHSTLSRYENILFHVSCFIPAHYKTADLRFKEVDTVFVQEFDYYLRDELKLSHNSIWVYMIGLNTICRLAMSRKHLAFNPFSEYRNTKKEVDRGYLLKSELDQLMNMDCKTRTHELVRDLFVFSCFTGLSYSDIKALKPSHIQQFFDGREWIIIRRKKTATASNVLLLDVPKLILKKYKGLVKGQKLLPVPCATTCNKVLKVFPGYVPELQHKKMTFHLARHTFATLFLSEGVPLESLSKMMGHKNIATTQIYAKILNEKVGKDMEMVAHKLKGLVSGQLKKPLL